MMIRLAKEIKKKTAHTHVSLPTFLLCKLCELLLPLEHALLVRVENGDHVVTIVRSSPQTPGTGPR